MSDSPEHSVTSAHIDHIPALWVSPDPQPAIARLVIWLPGLTGTKEAVLPYLQSFAAAGLVAVSLDPWQHGERGTESSEELLRRVFGDFRRHMWPILGQTALDVLRVIDWSIAHLGVRPQVLLGGISMGGDIAVAAAGLDRRVALVAAIVSTPDWLRPGMRSGSDPAAIVDPGTPDAYARFFYDNLNPLTHLEAYAHRPSILFACGADDQHVPPDGAQRFQAALRDRDPSYGEGIRVSLQPGVGHELTDAMWRECLAWLTES